MKAPTTRDRPAPRRRALQRRWGPGGGCVWWSCGGHIIFRWRRHQRAAGDHLQFVLVDLRNGVTPSVCCRSAHAQSGGKRLTAPVMFNGGIKFHTAIVRALTANVKPIFNTVTMLEHRL